MLLQVLYHQALYGECQQECYQAVPPCCCRFCTTKHCMVNANRNVTRQFPHVVAGSVPPSTVWWMPTGMLPGSSPMLLQVLYHQTLYGECQQECYQAVPPCCCRFCTTKHCMVNANRNVIRQFPHVVAGSVPPNTVWWMPTGMLPGSSPMLLQVLYHQALYGECQQECYQAVPPCCCRFCTTKHCMANANRNVTRQFPHVVAGSVPPSTPGTPSLPNSIEASPRKKPRKQLL